MVRVIPIYLAAELLCPNLFWERKNQCKPGRREAEGSRLHLSCEAVQGLCCEVYLIAAQLNSSDAGAVYEMVLNKDCVCHKAN